MDKLRVGLVVGMFLIANADGAFATARGRWFTTSTGAVFEQVEHQGFGTAWKDPDGKIWSQPFPGVVDNRSLDGVSPIDHQIQKSHATEICALMGGVVPTFSDYDHVRYFFETEQSPDGVLGTIMTNRGAKEFLHLFPEMAGRAFWTTTLKDPGYWAYTYSASNGYIGDWCFSAMGLENSLQCVAKGSL